MSTQKKQIIAIASSDWHIHKFTAFDKNGSRLNWSIKAAKEILDVAAALGVPHLFCGDIAHTWLSVETETMNEIMELFAHTKSFTYGISGNHDMSERNGLEHKSPSHLNNLAYLHSFHFANAEPQLLNTGAYVQGLPYFNDPDELIYAIKEISKNPFPKNKKKILMLHTDFPGAQTPTGVEIGEHHFVKITKLFKVWDLVIMGHIHKPMQLGKKFYMLGSPIHQNTGDMGTKMGYWMIYSDMTMEFVYMQKYPQFVREGEHNNDIDYIVPVEEEKANEEQAEEKGLFTIDNSRKKLANTYIKIKGIKSKAKKNALIKILNEVE